ncbi:putative F-box/kelch-repeat protein At5g24040 [Carex rostrata]
MPKQKTKSSTNSERNWSELPQDILHLFSKKLPDISDFIRFRVVCKSWQLSALVSDAPPQLPWLMEFHQGHEENAIIRFYCLSSGKVHTITCPDSRNALLIGPTYRYLLAYHLGYSGMYLLNPLTNDHIHVPPIGVLGCWLLDYIAPDPIEGGDIVVMSRLTTRHSMMAFWRSKANNWVNVKRIGNNYSGKAFYMGQHFINDGETGITDVIDISTQKLAYQVAPPKDTNPLLKGYTFMVVGSGGKILRLFQYYKGEQCHFDIHYLYFGDGESKPSWVKITDIGDQMLFLQYYHGLSLCASNFVGFKGNCIYFLKDRQYLCRYNIGDCTTEVLSCPFDSMGTWFVPSLV